MLYLILCGLVTGLVGPFVGIPSLLIVAKWTIEKTIARAVALALGTSLVQLLWAGIAAVVMFSTGKIDESKWGNEVGIIAALVLFYFAYVFWNRSEPEAVADSSATSQRKGVVGGFFTGVLISILAPQRTVVYVLFYAGFNVHFSAAAKGDLIGLLPLVLATGVGSVVTFLVVILCLRLLGKNIKPESTRHFSKIVAVLLGILGIAALFQVVK